jgi:predicted nucleotidyltransferase
MHERLKNLVERLHEALGSNLESVIVYGSAARGDFREGRSDLNVLCSVRSLAMEQLAQVAPVVKWWTGVEKQPAPLFFTKEELERSADVFAIELLDMQENHQVLYGNDVVAGIQVPLNLHRIQVEHDLRAVLIKLRQHFLHDAGNPAGLSAILAKSFSSVMTLLRHTLIAVQEKCPAAQKEVIAKIASMSGANAKALEEVSHLRESEVPDASVSGAYSEYLAAIERVISALDRHAPKHQWQRRVNRQGLEGGEAL